MHGPRRSWSAAPWDARPMADRPCVRRRSRGVPVGDVLRQRHRGVRAGRRRRVAFRAAQADPIHAPLGRDRVLRRLHDLLDDGRGRGQAHRYGPCTDGARVLARPRWSPVRRRGSTGSGPDGSVRRGRGRIDEARRRMQAVARSSSGNRIRGSTSPCTRRSSTSHTSGGLPESHRGIEGFGASSRLHTARILRLSEDLPLLI